MNEERHLAEVAARLRTAFELFETGLEMRRQQLRHAHPGLADSEIEALVAAWLRERPGADFGDAVGRPITLADLPAAIQRPPPTARKRQKEDRA